MLSEKLQEVSRDAVATEAVVTTTTQLFSRADGPFVQLELRLHPEMEGTGLLRGDNATKAREHEIRMMDDGGVDYVGVTMFSGHGATAVSDAVARKEALASAGVGVELWLSITQIMKNLLQHMLIHLQRARKSTRVPVSRVCGFFLT